MKIRKNKKAVKAAASNDYIYVIMNNGDPIAKGSYDAMTKKSYSYNYPVKMLKFPKAKLNSLMKMAKDAHRPDPLKFAVNRFINDYTDEYDAINSSCGKKSVNANWLTSGKKSDDGTFSYTIDEDKLYYGVPGAYFIWKGEWGDPWVEYDGGVYNASDLDSGVYSDFEEYCEENGLTFSDWRDEDNAFDEWAKEYGRDSAEGWLYDMSPFAEVIETSGDYRWAKEIGVNASTGRRRNTKAVKAAALPNDVYSRVDEGVGVYTILEDNGFERSAPNEPYWDKYINLRFGCTYDDETKKAYVWWNPDGNAVDLAGFEYDIQTPQDANNLCTDLFFWDEYNITEPLKAGLIAIGAKPIKDNAVRCEYEYSADGETTFIDLVDWSGYIIDVYGDKTEYSNIEDLLEAADIIR